MRTRYLMRLLPILALVSVFGTFSLMQPRKADVSDVLVATLSGLHHAALHKRLALMENIPLPLEQLDALADLREQAGGHLGRNLFEWNALLSSVPVSRDRLAAHFDHASRLEEDVKIARRTVTKCGEPFDVVLLAVLKNDQETACTAAVIYLIEKNADVLRISLTTIGKILRSAIVSEPADDPSMSSTRLVDRGISL